MCVSHHARTDDDHLLHPTNQSRVTRLMLTSLSLAYHFRICLYKLKHLKQMALFRSVCVST